MTVTEFFSDCMNTRIYDVEICDADTDEEYSGDTETMTESELIEREIINWDLIGNKFYFSVCE